MYLGLGTDIGSQPLFERELLDTNSGDPVNIALPKLQRETDSAGTPTSKLLFDYTIAQVENNSNRIDKSVLKADFCNTLDKTCQEVHHQNCEELSKQSLENALEFQGRVNEDFIKEKVSDIDIGSLLFAGELLDINSGDPVNIVLPKLQRETDSAGTPASKLLSDVTAQNLVVNFEAASLQPSKINNDFPKIAFLPPNFEQLQELSKQSLENALEFQGRADEDFIKEKVSDIDSLSPSPLFEGELLDTNSGGSVNIALPKLQQQTDSASTPAFKLLSDDTISESVLKEDFYKTLDKKCQEEHHQNFEELSKQSLKNALEIQGKFYENFIKEKVKLSKEQLVSTNKYRYPCIVTNCSFTEGYRSKLGAHLFKHIKVSPHYCEKCLPDMFFARNKTDLDKHKKSIHRSAAIPKRSIKRIHKPDQNTIVENNSARIDESVLKEAFYSTLDKKCQEEHDQNFEELSKQSLKNALEFQGRVYQHFTKEKVNFFEKQLVLPDGDKYPCVVTDCSFKNERKVIIKRHLFQHIKVSPYYCEQCLPHTFFARDMAALNAHTKRAHSLDTAISKRSIKRRHKPVQNTMNGSSGFTVNQVSGQQQTDSAGTPASNLLSDDTIAEVENNSNRIDKICQEVHHQNCEELSKQSPENALEFQGRADEDFIKEKVSDIDSLSPSPSPLFEGELLDTNSGGSVNIALPKLQQQTDSASTPASKLLSDDTISESVLKEDFYKTLDKKCQEEHHQNFEELSKQSLKNALEIQGEFYKNFIKEKVKLSKKQLVSPGEYKYPCIVTDCSFTEEYRSQLGVHLFKHIKVSPYYCEQCLPHTFFARDTAVLNAHKKKVHSLDTAISKRSIKRRHKPVQNTMNGSSRFNVNQVSDPCLLSRAKQAKIDP